MAAGLRYRDVHEMVHLLLTASGIINEGLTRIGYKPLGLMTFPLADTELVSILGIKEGPVVRILRSNTVLGNFLKGEGPIRSMIRRK